MGRRKKGEDELCKPIRFTARPEIAEKLNRVPRGMRSKIINAALEYALDRAINYVFDEARKKLSLEDAISSRRRQELDAIQKQ